LQALVEKFGREEFETLEAGNGEDGLATALKEHPDIILLDIVMPKMDGMTVLKKLREDEWGKKVPVILLTNLSATGADIIEGIVEQEPSYYLVKSDWKIEDVVAKVKDTLGTA